ncbi:Internalin-I [Diplonema papillatum]|nr:Internalin-I [Diplonema papillatum]
MVAWTQDPQGHVMMGQPVQPSTAYPAQQMPNPYYFQPPAAYYDVPPPSAPPVEFPPPVKASAPPPPFFYGSSAVDASAPPAPTGGECHAAAGFEAPPQDRNDLQAFQPAPEVVADFSNGTRSATDDTYNGDATQVTHLNYHANHLKKIVNLRQYPNLLRLTVSWNDLPSLKGIGEANYLRWVDASGNYLKDLKGVGGEAVPSLEWLNVTNSDIKSFKGLNFVPNLTWLCLHHNHFNDFSGVEQMPRLQFLDVSDNDVQHVTHLEKATNIREINICNNPMCEGNVRKNVESVKKLASLPYLYRLNINDTFYDPEEEEIVRHFKDKAPNVEVITTEARTTELGHNYKYCGPKGKKKKRCVVS